MKIRLYLTSILLAVLLVSACAPAATEPAAQPSVTVAVEAVTTPLVDAPSPTLEAAAQTPVELTATPLVDTLPVATSRGPDLHATDPTTVSLATGQLHFVEFFRFT
ncbi:MAG: hypothetical protein L0287_05600 [Anaerolineae bacterium]|nr:hypothetical protein [Anaerolineae bacterium]MCI0609443.1 hypothetical protein [Anaerolineae bacterium]